MKYIFKSFGVVLMISKNDTICQQFSGELIFKFENPSGEKLETAKKKYIKIILISGIIRYTP